MVIDSGKAEEFYGKVFDWEFEAMPGPMEYTMIKTDKDPGGGLMKKPDQAQMPVLMVYFRVEDIDATLGKVADAGGKTIVPKTEIGQDIGSFAVFADPDGIAVGIYQS